MKLSTKGRYALRAVIDLALHSTGKPVSVKDISERQDISPYYLEQLFARLRKEGLVKGTRGPAGGYILAKPAEEITALDIVEAAEGPIELVDCLSRRHKGEICERREACVTSVLWAELTEEIRDLLRSYTLADLRAKARQLRPLETVEHPYTFSI